MFDKDAFATDGLFPGKFTTLGCATVGAMTISVTIAPVISGGGGGWFTSNTKYNITIRVTSKVKAWEYNATVNEFYAKVIAKLLNKEIPSVTLTNIVVKENNPIVTAKQI